MASNECHNNKRNNKRWAAPAAMSSFVGDAHGNEDGLVLAALETTISTMINLGLLLGSNNYLY